MRHTLPQLVMLSIILAPFAGTTDAGLPRWRCWGPDLPDPCRNRLEAVSVVPDTGGAQVWAVGLAGTILRSTGAGWEKVFVDTDLDLRDVVMVASDHGWAVGAAGKVFTWDGSQWRRHPRIIDEDYVITSVAAVPGTTPTMAWAAYYANGVGDFLKFDGSQWKKANQGYLGTIIDVAMVAEDDGWAVGGYTQDGRIHHWNGSDWNHSATVDHWLNGVDFLASDDGWAVGAEGLTVHWNGTTWTPMEPVTHRKLHAVAMNATDDVWAVGEWGTVLHWDGSAWTDLSQYWETMELADVVFRGADIGWTVGEGGTIRRFDGEGWQGVVAPAVDNLDTITATPDTGELWAAGSQSAMLRFDGSRWATVPGSASNYYSVVMLSSDNGWANGRQRFHHWDGLRWEEVQEAESAKDMILTGPDEGWAVGWGGSIRRFNGTQWVEVASPTTRTLRGVSAAAPDDVWICGYSGTILHWNGSEWSLVDPPEEETFDDISMARPDLGFIVGLRSGMGVAIRWNGVNWQNVFLDDEASDLFGVDVIDTPSGAVGWMVGNNGYTARYANGQWYPESAPTSNRLQDVVTISADEAWAVGDGGVILYWSDAPLPEPPSGSLVTAAAKLSGQAGTNWMTDLAVVNLGRSSTTVEAEAWRRDQTNLNPTTRSFDLDPMSSRTFEDVLGGLFGLPNSSAASLLLAADQPLAVSSRTYNSTSNGTYGQAIPAAAMANTFAPGEVAVVTGITEGPAARSNLGLVNTSESPIRVHAEFFEAGGGSLGSIDYDVPARGSIQRNRVIRDVHSGSVDLAWATLRTLDGDFTAFLSTVDAVTGDPVYRPAELLGFGRAESILQGLARVAGAAGTNWKSSLTLVNTTSYTRPMTFERLVRGRANPNPDIREVSLGPGESMVIDDVLSGLFGMSNGAISLKIQGWNDVLMAARTFNQTAQGTYGQLIPAQPASDAIAVGGRGVLVGVVQNQRFRSNLGLTNPSSVPGLVSLTMVNRHGVAVGAPYDVALGPGEVTQIDRISEAFGASQIEGATLIVELAAGSSIQAFLSVIDSRTGDPVFQTPTLGSGP